MAPSSVSGERIAPADGPPSAFTEVVSGTLYLADMVYSAFVSTAADRSEDCPLDKSVTLEMSSCGRQVWDGATRLMMDSVLSWKHWLPRVVDVVGGLTFTSAARR
jgi:hypothetical protein